MILADAPPSPSPQTHQEWFDTSFRPGDFSQDIYTLPLEIGLISSLSYFYNPRSNPLLPNLDKSTDESNNATTYTRTMLLPYAIGTGTLVFGGLTLCNDDFSVWTQVRGFAHALLLSGVAETSAKVIFQEKRPNYDAQLKAHQGKETDDSRASFYSGHASQAFAFTTYTSLLMYQFSNSVVLSTVYTGAAVAASSVISYSRVQDHAHHLSDVIVGAIMGAAISGLTFFRVQEVNEQKNTRKTTHSNVSWEITPGISHDSFGKTWVTADFNLEI